MRMEQMYQEVILTITAPGTRPARFYDAEVFHVNNSCGDELTLWKTERGPQTVQDIS